jgi:hypothetical protein
MTDERLRPPEGRAGQHPGLSMPRIRAAARYAARQVRCRPSAVVTILVVTLAMSACGSLLRTTSILQNDQGHIARCSGHDTLADPMGKRAHDQCVADLQRYGYRVREKIE